MKPAHTFIPAADTHATRLARGRAHFDAAGYIDGDGSWTRPAHRESYALAFALIDAPLGGGRLRSLDGCITDISEGR